METAGSDIVSSSRECQRNWRIAFLVFCTMGLCLSADLARLHLKVNTDPAYHSYCAMSERVNCETVASSSYSVFMGLPLAVWGLIGYLGLGCLAAWGLSRKRPTQVWPFGMLAVISAVFSLLGIVLFFLSHLVIGSICIICTGTYIVNFALLFIAIMDLRSMKIGLVKAIRADIGTFFSSPKKPLFFVGSIVALSVILLIAVPPYWKVELDKGPGGLKVGVTKEGKHWIGAVDPKLVIIEFSDYQCPHCKRGHAEMRELLEKYPGKLRLVHRNYPLDHHCNPVIGRPFHPYSCLYARLAFCAGRQKKFWEANDYLFSKGIRSNPVSVGELARAIGLDENKLGECERSEEAANDVAEDMKAGRNANVRGTPTFVVNGRSYPGRIPAYVFTPVLGQDFDKK
ncbi:MAG: thioredoxin domain-containing protein [Deltaproteobacteria bacterium]|nr:thioredoxin domain-containing protein [Deltaproteobacteria bacterium]